MSKTKIQLCGCCCYEHKLPSDFALRGNGKCDDCGSIGGLYIHNDETRMLESITKREPSDLDILNSLPNAEKLVGRALKGFTNDR